MPIVDLMPRAPESLARELEEGWTLPAAWYSDPGVYERERDRIFARSWQYAARADRVAEPGMLTASWAGTLPVLLARARDGELRGFVNVCRHRGHPLCDGDARRETIQCPYHAWTYGLDGTLRRAPRCAREAGFEPAGFSLLPMAAEEWGPFVFASPDPEAAPLAETLGELPALVAESGVDLGALRFYDQAEWSIPVNWKLALEKPGCATGQW